MSIPTPDPGGPHLVLRPGLRLLWRSADEAQLELGDRAVVVDGAAPVLRALTAPGHAAGTVLGAGPVAADDPLGELFEELVGAGFADWVRPVPGQDDESCPPARLAPDVAAWGARPGVDVREVLRRRRAAGVAVAGEGRVPAVLASLLAAAGVGTVCAAGAHAGDRATVSVRDAAPGGLRLIDEGRRRGTAFGDAVRRAAPDTATGPPAVPPDLLVICGGASATRPRMAELGGPAAHLAVATHAARAVIGPLVLPGRSSCLHCADLHRIDRDPAWPVLAEQLRHRSRRAVASEDVVVGHLAAGIGAAQALEWIDGGGTATPATVDGTLEISPPDWRVRRRSWPRHPGCGCHGLTGTDVPPRERRAGSTMGH